jgi:DnaJ-class molecular chaperone
MIYTPKDLENNRVIWRIVQSLEPFVIPENYMKCPECDGKGKVIKIYRDPGPNEYMTCFRCMGKGYVASNLTQEK